MLDGKGHIAVFNTYRDTDAWDDTHLTPSSVQFFTNATSAFFRRSPITHHPEIAPVRGLTRPRPDTPRLHTGDGSRHITLWLGTPDERTILVLGDGNNELITRDSHGEHSSPIPLTDYESCKHIELTNLSDYPSLNERILLCHLVEPTFDPLREIAFNRPLPPSCKTYIDLISGQVPIAKHGY